MNLILVVLMIFTFSSCGKKKDSVNSGNSVEVICKTLRSENSSKCVNSPGVSTPANEICLLGFGEPQVPGTIIPTAVKTPVDNGALILINKVSGKRLNFKSFLDTNTNQSYLILQQEGDTGFTSSVVLPGCPN